MLDQSIPNQQAGAPVPLGTPARSKLRSLLIRIGAGLLARLIGTADGRAVGVVAARELSLILRSWQWHRFLLNWTGFCAALLIVPILYRSDFGAWRAPNGLGWFLLSGYALQVGTALAMAQWTIRRLRRDLYSNRLDELLLTRCSPADISMGEALASAIAALWLVAATYPTCLLVSAMAGRGFLTSARLMLSLVPAGALGVWFGMGWGMAFTLRRTAAMVPLTKWWFLGPFLPLVIGWSGLGLAPIFVAAARLIPGGREVILAVAWKLLWFLSQLVQNWNPFLTIGAAGGAWHTRWVTDWLVLALIMLFMMQKSMEAVQLSLGALEEPEKHRHEADAWIHHDYHHFVQYAEEKRRQPSYYDGGNPIAAFDVALGHRVYLHPFIWVVALMVYLFLLTWSLMLPKLGLYTGMAAVLIPATGALLLMSGGVAVSFAWERDQHRWASLAVLPISNIRLALGKIKGVVRPDLWVALVASTTALLLGWRGALPMYSAYWTALHVLVFPVTLACVSATLALTTPTLGESLARWAVLGALPTAAFLLPEPIGGPGGLALPFTPPLMVLLLNVVGPTPELVRATWTSLGLEVFGLAGSLLVLQLFLRRLTVGEKD